MGLPKINAATGSWVARMRNETGHKVYKALGLLWPRFSLAVEMINRNAEMMATIRGYEANDVERFADRKQMYSAVNERLGNVGITFLEFGVWTGESLNAWTSINTNATSRFYGFDSFEGLPEDWAQTFSTVRKGPAAGSGWPSRAPSCRVRKKRPGRPGRTAGPRPCR